MGVLLLDVLGSAAIASLAVASVMAYEGSLQLAGLSRQQHNPSRNRRNPGPPDV